MPFSATLASADSKFQELDERKTNEGDRNSLYRFLTSTTQGAVSNWKLQLGICI